MIKAFFCEHGGNDLGPGNLLVPPVDGQTFWYEQRAYIIVGIGHDIHHERLIVYGRKYSVPKELPKGGKTIVGRPPNEKLPINEAVETCPVCKAMTLPPGARCTRKDCPRNPFLV